MDSRVFTIIPTVVLVILLNTALIAGFVYLLILLVKALRKYLRSAPVRQETNQVRKSLAQALKDRRLECKMTQEFVAEHLGVSRQAVSKWESGASDPSTANLLALAKLYDIPAAELLKSVQPKTKTQCFRTAFFRYLLLYSSIS